MPSGVSHIFISLCTYLSFYFLYLCFIQVCLLELGRGIFLVCVVSLLSSGLTAIALVWFSNFLKCLLFPFSYLTEHCVYLYIFMDPVVVYVPRCVRNGSESLEVKALENFDFGIGGCPP
jgi:hypothetical protein